MLKKIVGFWAQYVLYISNKHIKTFRVQAGIDGFTQSCLPNDFMQFSRRMLFKL